VTVLLAYTFVTNYSPTTTAAGLTGSDVTNGSLFNFARGSAGYVSDAELLVYPASGATSQANAVSTSSYWYFTVTPDAGKRLDLTSLTMNMAKGSTSSPRGYGLRSSIDAYAADIQTADLTQVRTTWEAVSIDLSGAPFQNLTSAVTFRMFIYAPTTSSAMDGDDLTLNGTVSDTSGFTGLTVKRYVG
jgi:hypothetical protein